MAPACGTCAAGCYLLYAAVLWLTPRSVTALTNSADSAPSVASGLVCICSINVSDGRSLECRHYETDSQDLVYLSSRNTLLRIAATCGNATSLTASQPTRIHTLRPGRLLLMKGLLSLRLHQVGLRSGFQPDALRGLDSLEELELVGPHSLTRLEAHSFQHTPNLRRLILQDNGIEYIDRFAFCEAENLEHLDLSRNRILAYSCDWFPGLSGVTFLNVTLLTGVSASLGASASAAVADPPDCLFCPLPGLSQLSFNAWDLDTSRGAQSLRFAVNSHYQLVLHGPLLYNVTGLRDSGACGGVESRDRWQQCQRWRDGKPVSAKYVTLRPTSSATSAAAVTSVARVISVTDSPSTGHRETAGTNSSAVPKPDEMGDQLLLFIGSTEFLVMLATVVAVLGLICIASSVACWAARRRRDGARYSVKSANEAAAATAAANGNGRAKI